MGFLHDVSPEAMQGIENIAVLAPMSGFNPEPLVDVGGEAGLHLGHIIPDVSVQEGGATVP